ncbi:MAG: transposase [Acidobacteriota bacterium]|nr:MAG: transposase [Acidobacteriota bacterium]
MLGGAENRSLRHSHGMPLLPTRRNQRLPEFDYAASRWYFVTVCAEGMRCLFGDVTNEKVHLLQAGRIVDRGWNELSGRFTRVMLDEYIVMPNHLHGILVLLDCGERVSLSRIIGAFKSISAIEINRLHARPGRKVWQRSFFDRILRNQEELEAARRYIRDNPRRWALRQMSTL